MKTFSLVYIVSLLLLLPICSTLFAQPGNLWFENLSGQRGLPQNWVFGIYQDREGFMWFGTDEGLFKYDGQTAKVFKHNPNDPENSLRSNIIRGINEDQQGSLWVSTYGGGLHLIDKYSGSAKAYLPDTLQASGWNVVKGILKDQRGIFWLGTDRGIARFDPTTRTFTRYPSPNGRPVSALQWDKAGRIWAIYLEGVYQFDPQSGHYTLYPFPPSPADRTMPIFGFQLDADGIAWVGTFGGGLFRMDTRTPGHFTDHNLGGAVLSQITSVQEYAGYRWITSDDGLQRLDPNTNQLTSYLPNPSRAGTINANRVLSIYLDRSDNLWVGTGNGVNKVSLRSKSFQAYQIIPASANMVMSENQVANILQDADGTIWLGSSAGGLHQLEPKDQQIKKVTVNPLDSRSSLSGSEWPLLEDREGRLWVGTDLERGLYLRNRENGRFHRYASRIAVRRLDVDAQGKLWIGGNNDEGIASFDPATERFTYYSPREEAYSALRGYLLALMVSKTGEVWKGGEGLCRLDPKTGKLTHFQLSTSAAKKELNDRWVLCLFEDAEGILWIGTIQGGINRFDPKTKTFTYITTQEGLPSDRIESIIGDERGNLWIGTSNGLCRYNPKANSFRNFDESDGLPYKMFSRGSAYSRNGKLFFGTKNGFFTFHPDSILEYATPSPVFITGFKVLDKLRPLPKDKIELSYQENFLSFDFVALNYDAPDKNHYAYQLQGIDQDWVHSGGRRFASYTALPPGDYVFRVKVSDKDGVWNNEEASVLISILPPWWRTPGAYALYGMLGIGLLLTFRQYTVKQERLKTDLKLQRLEAEKMLELDQLKSRFFANISHEFRTPLTLILGPLEDFLNQEPQPEKNRQVYQLMHRNARRLLHLINQLLDLSRLEAARLTLEPKPGQLIPFLKGIVYSFTSQAERNQIHFTACFPETSPILAFDADKLEKIITNLISNALKFTPAAEKVEVLISLKNLQQEVHGQKQLLEIIVKDSGIGIQAHEKERVFDRFYQVDGSCTREKEGTGIGLALTKELVALHGGEISMESTFGQGSTFTVQLPLAMAEQPDKAAEELLPIPETASPQSVEVPDPEQLQMPAKEPKKLATVKSPLVLLVDDHPDVRFYVRENICSEYRVLEAMHGIEALALAVQHVPDLIISDVMMPLMDGVTLCHELKTDVRTSHIPVILLTAKAGEESKLQGLETGADDYLTKPFHVQELRLRVKNLLTQRALLREKFSRKITVEPKEVTVTSADEQFLQKALGLLEANMANADFDVETFGREMGMSRIHLHRKLKALTDQSPSDFIRAFRIKRASLLLEKNSGNISEIAFAVGFNSLTYFTRCFRHAYGISPSEYLQQQMQNKKTA